MTEYTGFETGGYDGDVASGFDTFEYSAPRNAHDMVFRKERSNRTVTDNADEFMINNEITVDNHTSTDTSNKSNKTIKQDISVRIIC